MKLDGINSAMQAGRERTHMHRRIPHIVALATGVLLASCLLVASAGPRRFVAESFAKRDFDPAAYDESAVVRAYGPGKSSVKDGVIYRWYRDDASGSWVRMASDTDAAPRFRTINEVMLASIGPRDAVADRLEPLAGLDLFGVSLGSSAEDAIRSARKHPPMRRAPTRLLGARVEELEFFPSDLNSGLVYRYFVRDGKVMAMSVGVTE